MNGELVDEFPIFILASKFCCISVYFKSLFTALLVVVLCAGCSSEQQDSSRNHQAETAQQSLPDFSSINTGDVFVYNCGDSLQFTAHVTQDSAWLFLPDTSLKVRPVKAGSGTKYEGSSHIYWSKGDEAILQKPKGSFMTCQTVPEEKAWQAARLRGVDFRALGQEPGWHLEITEGKHIRYVGNYGQDTVYTPAPDPQKDTTQQQTVYHAETESHTLKVEITETPCTDSMSGFKFPATVTITVDGRTYRGCGRALN